MMGRSAVVARVPVISKPATRPLRCKINGISRIISAILKRGILANSEPPRISLIYCLKFDDAVQIGRGDSVDICFDLSYEHSFLAPTP